MTPLVTIATYDLAIRAETERLLLAQEGIQAFLTDEQVVATNWFLSNAVGGVKLQVSESDAPRAAEILSRHRAQSAPAAEQAAGEIRFACQDCGRSIAFGADRRAHVETCPECGAYVDVPDVPPVTPLASAPGDGATGGSIAAARSTGSLWFEVVVVLCLTVFPGVFNAIVALQPWASSPLPLIYDQLDLIVWSLRVSLPLLLILSLIREPWARFGIVRFEWLPDIAGTIAIWVAHTMVATCVIALMRSSFGEGSLGGIVLQRTRPEGLANGLLVLVGYMAAGFTEELVMRGYLLTRLEQLLRSTWLAVLATTALFASYHLYQGAVGLAGATACGLVYGIAFCLLRRLWPLCLAHAMHNLAIALL